MDQGNANINTEKKEVDISDEGKKGSNNNAFEGSEEVESVIMFGVTGSGGRALRNPIVMKNISDYLIDEDLCQWYWSCKIFENIIDQMDQICWQKRAQKLAEEIDEMDGLTSGRLLRNGASVKENWPEKSFGQIFFLVVDQIRRPFNRGFFYDDDVEDIDVWMVSIKEIEVAASFAHRGLLGPVKNMMLDVDIRQINPDHLGSLAACMTQGVGIDHDGGKDHVLAILDNLKCEKLGIRFRHIGTEETRALLRAMKRVVKSLILDTIAIDTIDFGVLIQYDGKGKCERIEGRLMKDNESERIKTWAEQINWNITEDRKNQAIVIEMKKNV